MPTVFLRWLLGRFFRNLVVVGAAMSSLLALFDTLANASEVAGGSGTPPVLALLFYMLLRLPIIAVFVLPFVVLIASVQTFSSLAAQREILALESAGFTLGRIAGTLGVGAALLTSLQFVFEDRVVTELNARMNEWKADDYHGLPKLKSAPVPSEWFFAGNHLIHSDQVSQDGSLLQNTTIIEMDDAGVAAHYWKTEGAVHGEGGWRFGKAYGRDLRGPDQSSKPPPLLEEMPPLALSSFSKPVEELRFSQLRTLGWGNITPQLHPPGFYRFWTNYRLAQPLGGIAMVLLAAPLSLQVQRGVRRTWVSVGIFALGFCYFISQGVLRALGENGDIPALPATWGVFAVFGGAGLAAIAFRVK